MTSNQVASDGDILVIKATFKGKGISGIVCIVGKGTSGEVYFLDCAVANQEETFFPSLSLTFSNFEKTLAQYKKQYIINSQITIPLQDTLRAVFSPNEVKRIYSISDVKEQKKEVGSILSKTLKDITKQDVEINCEINIEDEYKSKEEKLKEKEKLQKISESKELQQKEEKEIIQSEIYLKIQLAVDPGKGKNIFNLCKGDKLLVKIVDDRPIAEYISSLLLYSKSIDGSYLSAPVIKAEELGDNKYRLIVKFGPGIFGETIIPPSIKIKTIKEEDEKQKASSSGSKANTFTVTPLIFFQSVILVLLIALIIFARIVR